MAKELQVAKKGGDFVTMSTWAELKKAILDEVLCLDIVMRALYSKFGTVHKAFIHLNGWQQRCAKRAHILTNIHDFVDYSQTWTMKYKGDPLHLLKMMRPNAVELKAHIRSQIWNYEDLPWLITSIQASHTWVFKSMDVVVCTHVIPSLGTLTQVNTKKQVWLECDLYFDELMCITTSPDLPINVVIMHKYVAGLATLKIMMHMFSDELDRGSRVVYPNVMGVKVRFQTYVTVEHMDTIRDYRAWHKYVTVDQHEDVEQLDFYNCLSQSGV